MKIVYTSQSWLSLEASVAFLLLQEFSEKKVAEIINQVFDRAESLAKFPYSGQREIFLSNGKREYRRLNVGHFKIIYFIETETVFITDIFDSRQDPKKMKG